MYEIGCMYEKSSIFWYVDDKKCSLRVHRTQQQYLYIGKNNAISN